MNFLKLKLLTILSISKFGTITSFFKLGVTERKRFHVDTVLVGMTTIEEDWKSVLVSLGGLSKSKGLRFEPQ